MDSLKLNISIQLLLGSSSRKIQQISHSKECLLYVCGCYIIFYSPHVDQQIAYIKHRNANISSITVSPNQEYLAIAEHGKYPLISVYSIEQALTIGNSVQQKPINILKGHKNSIDLIKFSSNSRYLVSICNNDGSMFIWQKSDLLTRNKLSKAVNFIMFDWNEDLLTAGNGYIKLWKFDKGNIIKKKQGEYWMIEGKPITFGKNFSTKNYIDGGIFINSNDGNSEKLVLLSSEGFICTINNKYDKVDKWIDLSMQNTSSLQIYGNLALCAGDNALIKIIDLITLTLKGKFPKPPPINRENIQKDQQFEIKQNEKFPKCLGIMIFEQFILTLYENSTIFMWVMNQQIKVIRSIITHRQKINCVCLLEQIQGDICFFGTASQDNTLRLWHVYKKCYENHGSIDIAQIIGIKRNAYCKNLTRIIYTDSEHPIIKMKIYMKKYIVCISKQQFLMYSLESFELIWHQNFSEQYKSVYLKNPDIVLSLQVSQNMIYLGFNNGFLKIYKPSQDGLLKLKQIQIGQPILALKLYDQRRILIQGKSKVIVHDFDNNSKNVYNNIICSNSTDKYLFLAQEKKLGFYNMAKNRKIAELSLNHEYQADQKVKLIKNNGTLVFILSTKDKLLISNFSATIIYSESINQEITDLDITETGQLILVGTEGNIIIKMINDSKYKQIQDKAKKWFELNDMSWMDNSVWANSRNHTVSNLKHRTSEQSQTINKINQSDRLQGLERAKSINLGNILGQESIKIGQIPSGEFEYKNDQSKMSIFNPSSIYRQANKIYNNVNNLMKDKNKQIDFSASLNDMSIFKSDIATQKPPKTKIFKQDSQQLLPKISSKLIESQMGQILQSDQILHQNKIEQSNLIKSNNGQKSSRPNQQDQTFHFSANLTDFNKTQNVNNSLKISTSLLEDQPCISDQQIVHTFKEIIEASKFGQENVDEQYLKSLIYQNDRQFRSIYNILDKIYGQKDKKEQSTRLMPKQAIIEQCKKFSEQYIKFLESNL